MRYHNVCFIFSVLMLGFSAFCHASVSIEHYTSQEFNPSKNTIFTIPVKIDQPGDITVTIYTSDGDLVRTLFGGKKDKAGSYTIIWDGKDESNIIVPDDAYIPVVKLITAGETKSVYKYDPRESSGGEEITVAAKANAQRQVIFQLERPSRILVRAGVKSGPMMKSILNWQVRGKGRNVVFWNGYDNDDLVNLYKSDTLALLVTGFELPKHSILTIGNKTLGYNLWRKSKKWPSAMPDLSQVKFERNGRRLSRHYYLPRSVDINPRITLSILDKLPHNKHGIPIVSGPLSLQVGMHNEDRWAMQQSLYEVAFFVDYEFLSEEEQGYVPLTWRWNPAGLKPGVHLITVNVSGFNGQVGVKSLHIEIPQ